MEPPEWMTYFWLHFGYPGVFLVSFIGTVSIIIPIPYTLLIFWLGYTKVVDPFLIMVAGGSGAALGELSGYALGYYGRRIVSQERQRKMNYLVKIFGRYGPIAVFIFSLTPLPDDLLFIPLGIMRYSLVKAFIPALIGKLLMSYILAYSGLIGGEFILLLFGEGNAWIGMVVTAVLLLIVIIILYRIDWEKVFERYVVKRGKDKR